MSDLAAAQLSDERIQVFKIDLQSNLFSRWKLTTDPNSGWSDWSVFPQPSPLVSITAGRLEDGRPQLFATDVHNGNWSCWKSAEDPNSAWTDWSVF